MRISWPLYGRSKSALIARVLTLALVSAACLLSIIFLQPAPVTYAASLSASRTSQVPGFIYPVQIYHSNTRLHLFQDCETNPSEFCSSPDRISAGTYKAECQLIGEEVQDLGYNNKWWVFIQGPHYTGWVSAIYVSTGNNDQPIPGPIPDCSTLSGTVWHS